MLTVQGLTKTFPNGKGIFDVSFSIQKERFSDFSVQTGPESPQRYAISWDL